MLYLFIYLFIMSLYIVYVINFKFTDIYLNITQSLHIILTAIFPGKLGLAISPY